MTGPTIAAAEEIALCLSCTRKDCDGGDADCAWGLVYWYERDPEQRRAYMRTYCQRNRVRRVQAEQARRARRRNGA